MAADWEFNEQPSEYFRATRGLLNLEVWKDKDTGKWFAVAVIVGPENADELVVSTNGQYDSFELGKLAAIDKMRELVETIHADFRGV
jgi:hypothetical protein